MKNIFLITLISCCFVSCTDDTEASIPSTPTNAHIIVYSYDCRQDQVDCLDDESNRIAGVSHFLYDSDIAFIQGANTVRTASSDDSGTIRWTEVAVQEYYLVSTFEDLIIEQIITANANTTQYVNVAFE